MDHAQLAHHVSSRKGMDKEAFVGAGLGLLARGLTYIPRKVMGAGASVAGDAAKATGRTLWQGAGYAPGTAALTTAGAALTVPSLMKGDPQMKRQALQKAMEQRYLAAQAGGMMKQQSVKYDQREILAAAALGKSLEKHAHFMFEGTAEEAFAIGAAMGKEKVAAKGKDLLSASLPKIYGAGLLAALGVGTAGAAMAGTTYAAGKGMEKMRDRSRGKRFSKMLRADPSLRRDPKARVYFNILDKASPYIAGEPHVAAATVRTMLDSPDDMAAGPRMMEAVLGIEEKRQRTRFPVLRVPTFGKAELPDV